MVSTDIMTELLRAICVARGATGAKASRALLQTTIATILSAADAADTHTVSWSGGRCIAQRAGRHRSIPEVHPDRSHRPFIYRETRLIELSTGCNHSGEDVHLSACEPPRAEPFSRRAKAIRVTLEVRMLMRDMP